MPTRGHLLVDGYNLAHAWLEMRACLGRRLDTTAALLVDRLLPVHDAAEHALTVVFDGKGAQPTIEHPDGRETLTLVYAAGGQTADGLIEQLLARAPSTEGWKVATNDLALGQTAHSYGADVLSAEQTAAWLDQLGRATTDWISRHARRNERQWRHPRP
ncbi:MAG: NYN domain-containing protein [Opitutales bacterium]